MSNETMDGVFIDIELDEPAASDPELAKKLGAFAAENNARAVAMDEEVRGSRQ